MDASNGSVLVTPTALRCVFFACAKRGMLNEALELMMTRRDAETGARTRRRPVVVPPPLRLIRMSTVAETFTGDAAIFARTYNAWCPSNERGASSSHEWVVTVLPRSRDLSRACACDALEGGRDHAEACSMSTLPTRREMGITRDLVMGGDGDEGRLRFAHARVRLDDGTKRFVIEHTWTPETLRGRGLGKKAVRGVVEFVNAWFPLGDASRGTYEDRVTRALERVDATCSYAKRALTELRRESVA